MRRIVGLGIVGITLFAASTGHAIAVENLLRNGSFELESTNAVFTEALHWKYLDPDEHGDTWGSASRESWRAVEGEFIGSIRGMWAGLGNRGGVWQEVPAELGATYQFSGWFFCDPEWIANTQEIMIEFWDAPRKKLIATERRSVAGCSVEWTEYSVTATAPEGAAWVRVVINVINIGAGGSLQFDDLALVKQPTAP